MVKRGEVTMGNKRDEKYKSVFHNQNDRVSKALDAILKNKDEILSDGKSTSALSSWKEFLDPPILSFIFFLIDYGDALNQKEDKND